MLTRTVQTSLQVVLLVGMIVVLVSGEDARRDFNMSETDADDRFLTIKLVDKFFTYFEDSLSILANNIILVINHIDVFLQFVINLISTVIDILIRQPANVINYILYTVTWIINCLVYFCLDLVFHTIIKGSILFLIWCFTSLFTLIIDIVSNSLFGILYLLRIFLTAYLNVFTFIFVYVIMPCFESIFWAVSFLTIVVITLWAVFEIWTRSSEFRVNENLNNLWGVLIFIPLGYALYNIWMIFCSVLLNFVCYPVIISAYSFCIGCFTYFIIILVVDTCKQILQNFDQEQVTTFVQNIRTFFTGTILRKLGHTMVFHKESPDQTGVNYSDRECIICFEERTLVKLFPCEHKVMCFECTTRVLENDYRCPICRATIRYYLTGEM